MRLIARSLVLFTSLCLLAVACASDTGDGETSSAPEPTAEATQEATPEPTDEPAEPEGSLASAGEDEPEEDAGPAEGGILRIGLADAGSTDPAEASPGSQSQLVLADLLYDTLTQWDAASGELEPALATSWELSDDLTTWEFLLDEAAEFSNGEAVTASDVKSSLEHAVSLDPLGPSATRLEVIEGYGDFVDGAEGISGIEVDGDHTLTIQLSAPFSQLPQLLASPVYGVVGERAEDFESVITSGSFEVVGVEDDVISLAARSGSGVLVDGIDVHLFEDRKSASEALEVGAVDWSVIDRNAAASLDGELEAFQAQVTYEMSVTQGVLSDVWLRRAIMTAVDPDRIAAKAYPGTASAVDGLVPGSGACGEGDGVCGYSPDAAKAFLKKGYPDGNVPVVHIDYYDDPDDRERVVAGMIAEDLQAVGIPAESRAHDFFNFNSRLAAGELELFRSGWVGLYPSAEAWLGRYHSKSLDNQGFLVSPEADAALAAGRSADDSTEADAAYAEAEAAILGSAPVLPLLQLKALSAASDAVQDLGQRMDGTFDVEGVWLLP